MRHLPAPDQLDLFAVEAPAVARCLYGSEARGLPARTAEFEAWKAYYGNWGSGTGWGGAHAWTPTCTAPKAPTSRCQPTVLSADTRRDHPHSNRPMPECGCLWDINDLQYRGACTGCVWEGPAVGRENLAVEDACGHAWPGWWDLPVVPQPPRRGTTKAEVKAIAAWQAKVNGLYPAAWLEDGGPIRTLRKPPGHRHVEKGSLFGGYDLAWFPLPLHTTCHHCKHPITLTAVDAEWANTDGGATVCPASQNDRHYPRGDQ